MIKIQYATVQTSCPGRYSCGMKLAAQQNFHTSSVCGYLAGKYGMASLAAHIVHPYQPRFTSSVGEMEASAWL